MSSEKQKIIIGDRFTTFTSVKPIKDCKTCDYHNDYTCFEHEHEQIKEVYPNSVKPIKDCKTCDYHNDYTCFEHEHEQIKEVYPNVHYTDDLEWVVYE